MISIMNPSNNNSLKNIKEICHQLPFAFHLTVVVLPPNTAVAFLLVVMVVMVCLNR